MSSDTNKKDLIELKDIEKVINFLDEHCPSDLNLQCRRKCINYDDCLTCWKGAIKLDRVGKGSVI